MKKILVSLALLVLLVAGVFAVSGFPSFSDIAVSTNIENAEDPFIVALSWGILNNGGEDIRAKYKFGFSKWNFETEKWDVVEEHSSSVEFSGGMGGMGFGTERELGPGYYMSWIKSRSFGDLIRENNGDRDFVWVDETGGMAPMKGEIVYEEI